MFLRIYLFWRRLRSRIFSELVAYSFKSFGCDSIIELPVRIVGFSHISIGEQVYVGEGAWLNVIKVGEGKSEIEIGDRVNISGHCVISAAREIVIEDSVLMARNVFISDHSHRFDDPSRPIVEQGITEPRPIRIGKGAWLGQNVVICPGVTIGRGAVIGANSVVKDSVPEFCVAAGAPATVKKRFAQGSKFSHQELQEYLHVPSST